MGFLSYVSRGVNTLGSCAKAVVQSPATLVASVGFLAQSAGAAIMNSYQLQNRVNNTFVEVGLTGTCGPDGCSIDPILEGELQSWIKSTFNLVTNAGVSFEKIMSLTTGSDYEMVRISGVPDNLDANIPAMAQSFLGAMAKEMESSTKQMWYMGALLAISLLVGAVIFIKKTNCCCEERNKPQCLRN